MLTITHRERDILDEIAEREARPAPRVTRKRMMWQVFFGTARDDVRRPSRLLPHAKAKRLAARFNRMFRTDVAYAVRFGRIATES